MRLPIACRVCGLRFTPKRFDAVTCSSTCRQRLHRGGDAAFVADLPRAERAPMRRWLKASAMQRAVLRNASASERRERAAKREHRHEEAMRELVRELIALPDDAFEGMVAALREARAKRAADA
jgi:hypothetical protein